MRIKKVSETTPINGKAIDSYSSSTTDAYSCNYINQNVISKNKLDMYSLVDGYISANGAYNSGHTQEEMRSDFIKVKPNTTHTFTIFETTWSGFGTNNWMAIAEYTSDNTSSFVTRTTMGTVSQNYITVTTSATTKYMIVCARGLKSATKVQLEESAVTTTYQKYFTNGVVNTLINNEKDMAPSVNVINKLHTYSTTEQVIGTWIDGKPTYRKTIVTNKNLQAGNSIQRITVQNGVENLKRYLDIKGTCYFEQYGTSKPLPVGLSMELIDSWSLALRDLDSTSLTYDFGKSLTGNIELITTIEYTKTTD